MARTIFLALATLPLARPVALAPSEALSVLALTPSTSSASTSTPPSPPVLSGREAITLTFSRAVIPLGSDFGPGELPEALTPFALHPPVAGKLRWVTTSVARFDPDVDWPPELLAMVAQRASAGTGISGGS